MQQRLLPALLAAFAVACGGSSKPAEPGEPTPPKPEAQQFDEARIADQLDRYVESIGKGWGEPYQLSGLIHMTVGDRVLYSRGFGYADREAKLVPNPDTSFRIGSVTKQFTAAGIMLLVQDGKLALTDSAGKHIPDLPAPSRDVTIEQLLTHTSGIPSYTSFGELMDSRDQPRTVHEMLALFADKPLEFAPGTKFAYSNSGYFLLGAVIEAVSGRSYADFMSQRIFAPAGLTRTVVGDAASADNRAIGYQTTAGGAIEKAPPIDMSIPYAAGAIRSTATDLARWDAVLRAGTLVTEASQEQMYTPAPPSVKNGTGYGYGWLITEGKDRVIHHDGGIDGFLTSYVRIEKAGLVLTVWTNNPIVRLDPIREAAVLVAFGGTAEPVEETPPEKLDPDETARIVGSYRITDESRQAASAMGAPDELLKAIETIEIREQDGGLVTKPAGQPALALHRTGPGVYANKQVGATVTMKLPAEGPATGFDLKQGPVTLTYVREP
jgi:CubicO group peptidase (beta-lactamase class C family)